VINEKNYTINYKKEENCAKFHLHSKNILRVLLSTSTARTVDGELTSFSSEKFSKKKLHFATNQ